MGFRVSAGRSTCGTGLGTKGGLLTDADGAVIGVSGLYAAGNTTASVMGRTYPGPGSTIAPAVVFGYRAGRAATADLLTR
ncbi:FAD-binding protein [Actinoplanes missouriensis]|uniref:FAD-binding protein n=1 Tax=Actinoplanes missouriensis TaxID=1866 RepID=UPI003F4CB41D